MTTFTFIPLNPFPVRAFPNLLPSKCPQQLAKSRRPQERVSAVSNIQNNEKNESKRRVKNSSAAQRQRKTEGESDDNNVVENVNNASTENGGAEIRGTKSKRRLTAESRAKISAALKGRQKSDAHRESLSQRLSGQRNPMYGRKLSEETKQKISRALTGRRKRKEGQKAGEVQAVQDNKSITTGKRKKETVDSVTLDHLRDVAKTSRFMTSIKQTGVGRKVSRRELRENEHVREKDVDSVLRRVASFSEPPDNVARLLQKTNTDEQPNSEDDESSENSNSMSNATLDDVASDSSAPEQIPSNITAVPLENEPETTDIVGSNDANDDNQDHDISSLDVLTNNRSASRHQRKRYGDPPIKEPMKCKECNGTGFTKCADCVRTFGVTSPRCSTCFGAGATFCDCCDGVGLLPDDQNGETEPTPRKV